MSGDFLASWRANVATQAWTAVSVRGVKFHPCIETTLARQPGQRRSFQMLTDKGAAMRIIGNQEIDMNEPLWRYFKTERFL